MKLLSQEILFNNFPVKFFKENVIVISAWCYSPFMTSACQPTESLRLLSADRDVTYPVSLGVTCDQHVESQVVDGFTNCDYCYKSIATKFILMLDWHRFHTLAENSSLTVIEPTPYPVTLKQYALNRKDRGPDCPIIILYLKILH